MKKIFVFALAISLLPMMAYSQGGSNYSVFGIGDIFSGANAAYQAIGGTFIAVPSESSVNIKNPALWGTAGSTRLMTGYNFNQHLNVVDDETLYQNNGKISGIYTLFNVDKELGVSVSFGLHSYSSVNYLISNKFRIAKDDIVQDGTHTFQGSGGLSSAYLGASTKIVDGLLFGASAFVLFGPVTSIAKTEFDDYYTYNYEVNQSDYASGWGSRLGLYYSYDNFNVGAYYENVSDIDFDRETRYISSVITDTLTKSSFTQKMPSSFGIGLSYKTGKFLLASDFSMINASNLKYNEGVDTEFQNAVRFSLGAIRYGSTSRSADYLDRVGYKAGFSYQQMYYKVNGNNLNELSFSLGAEMPIGLGGVLDAALVFGTRGSNADNLIKEYFGKMYVEISIGEIWFKPFKRRY